MRQFRKTVVLVVVALFALSMLAACGQQPAPAPQPAPAAPQPAQPAPAAPAPAPAAPAPAQPEEPKEPIKIGALFDVTGGASSLGTPERDTVLMLTDQINAAGGINGHPIDLIFIDGESDETKNVLAMKRLIERDQVVAIVGGTTSGGSLAIKGEAERAGVPFVSVAASVLIVEPVTPWTFKTPANDVLVIQKIIDDFLVPQNIKRVGWLNVNNAFGDGGRAEFEKLAPNYGIEIVVNDRFDHGATDMTAQLARVKTANPEAVIVWSIPPSAAVVAKNFRQLDFQVPMIQSHGIANQAFIDLAEDGADGVIFPAQKLVVWDLLPDTDPVAPVARQYVRDFMDRFGYFPTTFGSHAYDGFMMIVDAIEHVGPNKAAIRDHLEGLTNFVTAGGVFTMSPTDHAGMTAESLVMVQIKDGKWVPWSP